MEPVYVKSHAPTDLNKIPVDPELAVIIHEIDKKEWQNFWNFVRLNLQGRINGEESPDEIKKLQGKIEFISEISGFFDKISQKRDISSFT